MNSNKGLKIAVVALSAALITGGALVYTGHIGGANNSTPVYINNVQPTSTTQGQVEAQTSTTQGQVEAQTSTAQIQGQASAASVEDYITADEATTIALSHANIAETDTTYLHNKLDYDDGRAEYDVEFWVGNIEYDYEIDAISGEVLSYDYDAEFVPSSTVAASSAPTDSAASVEDYITADEATSIALSHANIAETDTSFLKSEFDFDDGFAEYEVEWNIGRTEYDYTINALTGEVLEFDVDHD